MAASIGFYAGENFTIQNLGGSGLGFYADGGFGFSIQVGQYNGRTFITSSDGATEGPEVDNLKWQSSSGVILGQSGSGILLTEVPNYMAPLNIRFTNDSAVKTQNVKLYAYDRTNKNNYPSGVTFKAFEIIHPNTIQSNTGSGDVSWHTLTTGDNYMDLAAGAGVSGLSPNGVNTEDDRHDWYIGVSLSPTTVGAKTQLGFLCELEYL